MIGLNLIEDLFLLEPSSTTDELTIDSKTQAKEGPIISYTDTRPQETQCLIQSSQYPHLFKKCIPMQTLCQHFW
jgi:hypothetical protein